MKTRISIVIIIFLLFAHQASAFQQISPDAFKSPIRKFFERIWECKFSIRCYTAPRLGAFSQISSATVISGFPTIYNANLNITMETGTTSVGSITTLPNLVSISTITTGSWTASTVATAYGGTGSTTLNNNGVLLGRGANGIGNVNGYGSSGQFLTSGGSGAAPTWTTSAVDLAGTYAWTGYHSFAASSTFGSNARLSISASTSIAAASTTAPLTLNGVAYGFPATRPASSTYLAFSGDQQLYGVGPDWQAIGQTVLASGASSITVSNIPPRTDLMVVIAIDGVASADTTYMQFNSDTAGNYGWTQQLGSFQGASALGSDTGISMYGSATTSPQYYDLKILNKASVRKLVTWIGSSNSSGANVPQILTGAGVWNNTSARINTIKVYSGGQNYTAGSRVTVYGSWE